MRTLSDGGNAGVLIHAMYGTNSAREMPQNYESLEALQPGAITKALGTVLTLHQFVISGPDLARR